MKRTDPAAFWARVAVSGVPDQCWEWQGSKRPPSNYGTVSVGGRLVPAHRRAWELTHGLIPVGLHVLHKCDNPPCVNPDHLFLGTASQNMQDMWAKGRHDRRQGERVPWSKFTTEQVLEIRAARAAGEGPTAIARRYGVRKSAIQQIVNRETWTHV